jgi:hypothetical protein
MVAIAPLPLSPPPASGILLPDICWETHQALVWDLESQSGERLTYDNGWLAIFMPLLLHKSYKRWTGRFVETLTEELDIEIRS